MRSEQFALDGLGELHNEEKAAAILNVKVETLATQRSQGRGSKYIKLGRAVFYPDVFLKEYLLANVREPEPASARRQRKALAAEARSQSP